MNILNFLFKYKKISLMICFGIFISCAWLAKYVGTEFIPSTDTGQVTVSMRTPQGTTLEKTQKVATLVSQRVEKYPEVTSVITTLGGQGVENAKLLLNLTDAKDRSATDLEIIQRIIVEIADIPDVEADITRGGGMGGSGDMTVTITGFDYDKMIEYSKEAMERMRALDVFRSISSNYQEAKSEYRFIPDQKKLVSYGVTNAQIATTIRSSLYGNDETNYKDNNQIYDILIEVSDRFKDNESVFDDIFVASSQGMIPVSKLGTIEKTKSYSALKRLNRSRVIEINGYLGKSTLGDVQPLVDKEMKAINMDPGYNYSFTGMSEFMDETFQQIFVAFFLAVIFTYMVLAATMNSFLHPFTIATCIITSFGGVFVLMFFTGATINIGSLLAMIMLVGLTVNAAIILLDRALEKIRTEGKDIETSLRESAIEKLRTILMTSVAIVFGTLPQLFAANMMKISMGSVIIGGIVGSMIFTLTLIPLLFYYFETGYRKISRLWRKEAI